MTHEELRELLGAYALDALSGEERDAMDAHLPTCAQCQAEVAELSTIADRLALLTVERDPPPALRDRLLASVEQDRLAWEQARAADTASVGVAERPLDAASLQAVQPVGRKTGPRAVRPSGSWWRRVRERLQRSPVLAYGAGGLVALALIVLGVWLFNRNNVTVLHTYACAPQSSVGGQRFTGTNCTLQVRSDQSIEVAFNDLPTLRSSQAYELWVIPHSGNPVPVTGFAPGGTRRFQGTYRVNAARYAAAAVTVERAPGNSAVPHLPIVLLFPFNSPGKTT